MATAVINELFEEGITRSRELADAADEAMRAIDAMATGAEELAQRVDTEAAEARQHVRELVERLSRAEGALETAGDQAEGALTALSDQSGELATEAAALLDRVQKSLAELETRREAVEANLTARLSGAQDEVTELAGRTLTAQNEAEEALQKTAQALADFRTAIDTARAEFGQKQQAWAAAADELQSQASAHTDAWVTGLTDLLQRQSGALVEAANSMVDEHNAAMEGLRTRFVQQAPQHLAEAVDPVESELAELGQSAERREQELTAEAERLARWADAAEPLVADLRTALDDAATVG